MCISNGNNIDVHFANAEAATFTVELELHGMNLRMFYNDMERYKIMRIICRKS
jgi:hypothetical protein